MILAQVKGGRDTDKYKKTKLDKIKEV